MLSFRLHIVLLFFFFFQAEDGIRDLTVTGVQTCALPISWADVPSLPPGAKIAVIEGPMNEAKPFTVRLKFPANYKIPAHSHPAIEHVTVISGTFNMGTGDKLDPKQTKALSAGSVAIVQPKVNHFGWTKTATIVQLHGVGPWGVTYVNPSDDPRKK